MACHAMRMSQNLKVFCLFMFPMSSSLSSKEEMRCRPCEQGLNQAKRL
jgi:hypothetical protein